MTRLHDPLDASRSCRLPDGGGYSPQFVNVKDIRSFLRQDVPYLEVRERIPGVPHLPKRLFPDRLSILVAYPIQIIGGDLVMRDPASHRRSSAPVLLGRYDKDLDALPDKLLGQHLHDSFGPSPSASIERCYQSYLHRSILYPYRFNNGKV